MDETNLDLLGFDDVADSRPTIPDGEYHLRVVSPEVKDTNDKTSKYIQYDVVVQSGPHAGYRVFRGMFSLKKDKVWQFKRDMKAVGFDFPQGLTILEAAQFFVDNANGFEFYGKIGSRALQVEDDNGNYVADPDGGRENTVRRWISVVN